MENENFKQRLQQIIECVFEHDNEFMETYFKHEGELISFYVSNDDCKYTVVLPEGQHVGDYVGIDDVLEFVDKKLGE